MPILKMTTHLLSSIFFVSLWMINSAEAQSTSRQGSLLFAATSPSKTTASSKQEELSNPAHSLIPSSFPTDVLWVAKSLNDKPYTPEKNRPTFTLTSSKTAIGFSGCNRFTSPAEWNPETIAIHPLSVTLRGCPPEIMSMENTYLSVLGSANRWSNQNGLLKISGEKGTLIFERALITD